MVVPASRPYRFLLPLDIWLLIASKLGFRDRNDLYPLLFLNRDIYKITLPILYQTISLEETGKKSTWLNYPKTIIRPNNIAILHSTLSTSTDPLCSYITHLSINSRLSFDDDKDVIPWEHIVKIVRLLTNLRSLELIPCQILRVGIAYAISPLAPLTRLSVHSVHQFDGLEETLDSHWLDVPPPKQRDSLPVALRTLRTFDGCPTVWDSDILRDSHIEHGGLSILANFNPSNPAFRTLRTLNISVMDRVHVANIAPYLESVELLRASSWSSSPFMKEDFLSIPSKVLKYIRIGLLPQATQSPFAKDLFDALPSLSIVDFSKKRRDARYLRDTERPATISVPDSFASSPLTTWWECCEGIKDIVETWKMCPGVTDSQ
ncbi:hypothetical protein ONZ45_g2742 [Pleurotus djamor]|nr:hypothetical protein ONZ45_g2742 [Pleurotus djamor]